MRIAKSDGAQNLILLGAPMGETVTIWGLALNGHASLMAKGVPAQAEARGEDSLITFSRTLTGASAPVIRIETSAA